MKPDTSYAPAIAWTLLSTFLWTLIFAAGKFTGGEIGAFQLTWLRYLGALGMLALILRRQGGLAACRSAQPALHLARAVCGCGAAVAITWASTRMQLVDATAIGMLYGVFAVALGALVLRESLSRNQWAAIACCLFGVAMVMVGKGAFQGTLPTLPAVAALLSAILLAIEGLLISMLGRAEAALSVMLHVTVFGCALLLIPALAEWQGLSLRSALLCLALGPVGLFAQYCTIRGYRGAPLSVVAPIDYAWLFFSALLGLVVFDEGIRSTTWLGCAIILLGGAGLARAKARQ